MNKVPKFGFRLQSNPQQIKKSEMPEPRGTKEVKKARGHPGG